MGDLLQVKLEVQVMLELLTKNAFEAIMTENENKRQDIIEYIQMIRPSSDTEYSLDNIPSIVDLMNDLYTKGCIDTLNIIMDQYEDIDVPARKYTKPINTDTNIDVDNLYKIMNTVDKSGKCDMETLQSTYKDIDVRKYIKIISPQSFDPVSSIGYRPVPSNTFKLSSYGRNVLDLLKRIKRDGEYDE